MERIKLQEIKKTSRNLLRNNKNIHFEINRNIYLNYFCDNMKDIIIIEKLLLILEPLITSKRIAIHKKEETKIIKNQNETDLNKKSNELQGRGRTTTKEIRHTQIDLTSEKNTFERKFENEKKYQSKSKGKSGNKGDLSLSNVTDGKRLRKKKKEVLNTSLSKSHSPDYEMQTRELIKSIDFSNSKIEDTNLNLKKKRRKTKQKNKIEIKPNEANKADNLSEDKSYISDDNVEKNRLNFLHALQNITKNMLLESKIKGENVEYIIEPDVIPDLDKILAQSASKRQKNMNDFNKHKIKEMNLSNDEFDYNNITDRSNIHVHNQRNKNVLTKNTKNITENVFNISQRSIDSNGSRKDFNSKINQNEVNISIIMNKALDENKEKCNNNKLNSDNNNFPATDRSGIYRINDNSKNDFSKENRLELVSTNDKNESKKNGKEIFEKFDISNKTNNLVFKLVENKSEIDKKINGGNIEIGNIDIILKEKTKDIDNLRTKNTNEINSLGKNMSNIKEKNIKNIESEKNIIINRKNREGGCKCACSVF